MRSTFAMLFVALIVLAACSPFNDDDATPTPQFTPTPEGIKIEPPALTLQAPSGEQPGSLGPYFWALENGVAADVTAPGFVIPSDTLRVESGARLGLGVPNGQTPRDLLVRIYPKDGNIKQAATRERMMDAFVPSTEPVTEFPVDPGSPSWTVELDPGEYFVWVKGTWQHPMWPTKPPTAEYAYLVQVQD